MLAAAEAILMDAGKGDDVLGVAFFGIHFGPAGHEVAGAEREEG
jgi:hypothetical protein